MKMIRDVVESEKTCDRYGWQERFHGKIDEAFVIEGAAMNDGQETHLLKLLKYYLEIHDRGTPAHTQFMPEASIPELSGRVSYIDVSSGDPERYAWLNHQPSPFQGVGEELSGLRLIEHPLVRNALSCLGEYRRCSGTASPEFALIDQHMNNGRSGVDRIAVRRAFYRVMLPLADEYGEIAKIAYSFRRIKISDPGVV